MKLNIIIILQLVSFSSFGQIENLKSEIAKIIRYDTEITFEETPVSMVSIIDRDSTFYLSLKSDDDLTYVDEYSTFETGSITKIFTSSLISILEEERKLNITDKVNKYLPEQYRNPRLKELSIWDLINHYGGFSRVPEYFGKWENHALGPYVTYSNNDLLEYYKNYVPKKEATSFSYSHTGYAILETIIANLCNTDYQNVLMEKIFIPLGMNKSFIHFPENQSIVQGYDRAHRMANPWKFNSFAGAEGLKSNVRDLSLFIRAHFDKKETPISQVLIEQLEIEAPTNYNDKIFIGNGWHILQNKGKYNIFVHSGKTSGHAAFLAFIPETKTGVVILSNSVYGTKDLGFLILRMINDNWNRKL